MSKGYNPFGGIELYEDPRMVVTVVRRVPGGYMNRWLIRAEVVEPSPYARIGGGKLFAHPAVIARIKSEIAGAAQ